MNDTLLVFKVLCHRKAKCLNEWAFNYGNVNYTVERFYKWCYPLGPSLFSLVFLGHCKTDESCFRLFDSGLLWLFQHIFSCILLETFVIWNCSFFLLKRCIGFICLHMSKLAVQFVNTSPILQCSERNCAFSVYFLTAFLNWCLNLQPVIICAKVYISEQTSIVWISNSQHESYHVEYMLLLLQKLKHWGSRPPNTRTSQLSYQFSPHKLMHTPYCFWALSSLLPSSRSTAQ